MSQLETLLLTGASGFIGRNILPILLSVYDVTIWRRPYSEETDRPFDLVLHCAGMAHQKGTLAEFLEGNYENTRVLCECLRQNPPKHFIFFSTVAVYGCEQGEGITEEYPLNGNTPYALSKIKAEQFLQFWCDEYGVQLSILRIPLVAGKNPPGNLGLMIKGIKRGFYFSINGGMARKSMVLVEDLGRIIPLVVIHPGIYNVCADYAPSFRELEVLISTQLRRKVPFSIPYGLALMFGKKRCIKMCETLTFSNERVKRELHWRPLGVLDNFQVD